MSAMEYHGVPAVASFATGGRCRQIGRACDYAAAVMNIVADYDTPAAASTTTDGRGRQLALAARSEAGKIGINA